MNVLQTGRLWLRELASDDAAFMRQLLNEPTFVHFIGDRGVRSLDDARSYIAHGPVASYAREGFGLYLVVLKQDVVPIGICGLLRRPGSEDVEIGFAFLRRFWSAGYAFESAAAVMAHAAGTLGLKRITAITSPQNLASIRLLRKLGLQSQRRWCAPDGAELELFASNP
jgi:RimJ/RimL family protein N-acetyltransferase